jgi:DNA repair exonuclease SbcCD nuclease subunit
VLRVLHLADLHLGWRPHALGGREDERGRERDGLLARAVDWATDAKNAIGLVIIAGDLFESFDPPPALLEETLRQLRRLVRAGVALVTVPGNHDEVSYPRSAYRALAGDWPGLLVLNPMPALAATLAIGGAACHIYGCAYVSGVTQTAPPLCQFPRGDAAGVHVAAFHGSLDWGGDRSLPLDAAALLGAGYDYVALGHIHRPAERRHGKSLAVYPGAIEAKGFDDAGCGSMVVACLGDGPARVERVPISVRPCRVHALDAGRYDSLAALLEAAAGLAEGGAMVRLQLSGSAPFALDAADLAARLAPSFWYLEVEGAALGVDEALISRLADEPTVRGVFIRRLRGRIAAAGGGRERGRECERELQAARRALLAGLDALRGEAE